MLKTLFRPILVLLSSIMMVMGLSEIPQNVKQQADDSGKQGLLTVRFLDVGQADAAIVIADGEAMLIDGGNVSDSSLIVSALRRSGVSHLNSCTLSASAGVSIAAQSRISA